MASTPSPSLQLEIPDNNSYRGEWADVMTRLLTQIDGAIAGATEIETTGGNVVLSDDEYVTNDTRQAILIVSCALASNCTLFVPARSKRYVVVNKTTGAFSLFIKTASGDPMACPAQGSVGELRAAGDGSIYRIGPYVNQITGAITSATYALQSALNAEIERASEAEGELAKLDGSRSFIAPQAGVDPTDNNHFATKRYVDNLAGIQDDIFATTGSSTAYVVTTGRNLSLFDGLALTVLLHATNGQSPTLVVDGSAAKPIRGFTGKPLPPGIGIQGSPYRVIYVAATQEFLLSGFFDNPYQIPVGGFLLFCSTNVPNSRFALPFGQAISRTTYATLWNLIGTTFGAGDGASTFNLPDFRGRSFVGLDNMGGAAAGRITEAGSGIIGTTVGAIGGAEKVFLARSALPNVQLEFFGDALDAHGHPVQIGLGGTQTSKALGGFAQDGNGSSAPAYTGAPSNVSGHQLGGASAGTPSGTIESMNGNVVQTPVNNMPPVIVLPVLLRVI